jgi:hypothetical protein
MEPVEILALIKALTDLAVRIDGLIDKYSDIAGMTPEEVEEARDKARLETKDLLDAL